MATHNTHVDPRHVGFFLIPGFSMMSFTAAVEPLRSANRLSGRELYAWRLYSADGDLVQASNGIDVRVHGDASPTDWPHVVLVCTGPGAHAYREPKALRWLQAHARRGAALGGISSGTHVLARARLLDGYRCTIHWEHLPALVEEFPHLEVTDSVFEIDRDRLTCCGGTSGLDMMLAVIRGEHGPDLAAAVANQFIHDRARTPGDHQRMGNHIRLLSRSPKLAAAIQIMEENLEAPLSREEVAEAIGVSTRQLERLFRRYCGTSPKRYYLELRLQHARLLLLQTGMAILDIALASGFETHSYFAKCYRERFGRTPTDERKTAA